MVWQAPLSFEIEGVFAPKVTSYLHSKMTVTAPFAPQAHQISVRNFAQYLSDLGCSRPNQHLNASRSEFNVNLTWLWVVQL